jgi:hypothetical protein
LWKSWQAFCQRKSWNLARSPKLGHAPRQNSLSHGACFVNPVFLGHQRPSVGLGYRTPLLSGEAGTAQTIKLMRRLVDSALSDAPFVRRTRDIVSGVAAYDEAGEVQAVYNWVQRNIRFTKDPLTKETLFPPQELLKIKAGDCDDISMLIGAMLLALGYPARLITIAANAQDPDEFSHVYVEAELPPGSGNWIAADAARYGAQFGVAPPSHYRKRAWSLVDDNYQDLSGMTRMRGLAGYTHVRGLGDDFSWGDIITQGLQETPQIIAAVQGQPSQLRNAYGSVQTGPYSSFATPYTPGYAMPGAGYTASVSATPWLWPVMIGLAAILLLKGRS